MTWFKVDDSFYDHPKVFDAPDCAVALWTRAGTWSARNLTDGFVPAGMPARLCDDPDTAVKELVRRGLWSRTSGGYRFHDWAHYQPSRDAVEDLRAKRADAGRKGGQAKAARAKVGNGMVTTAENASPDGLLANAGPETVTSANKQNASNAVANASPVGKQNAAPARPGPSRSTQGGEVPHGGRPLNEPPTTCPEHENDANPPPCGACKQARETHEQWARNRAAQAALRTQAAARERADLRRAEIDACGICDAQGYIGNQVCTHDPGQAARAARGAAEARNRLSGLAGGPRCETHPGQPADCTICASEGAA